MKTVNLAVYVTCDNRDLMVYSPGEYIRRATKREADLSYHLAQTEAAGTGAFRADVSERTIRHRCPQAGSLYLGGYDPAH